MRYNKKVTNEMVENMKEMRNRGISDAEIGRQLGIDPATVTYHIGNRTEEFNKRKGRKLSGDIVAKMLHLRGMGLSNAQIAMELDISGKTVFRKIGAQKSGSRSEYGSLVTHADGERFAPPPVEEFPSLSNCIAAEEKEPEWLSKAKAEQEKAKGSPICVSPNKLQRGRSVIAYEGKRLEYIVDSYQGITIKEKNSNLNICMTVSEFNNMLEELMELIDKIPSGSQKEQPA